MQTLAWEALLRAALGSDGKAAVAREDLKVLAAAAAKTVHKAAGRGA